MSLLLPRPLYPPRAFRFVAVLALAASALWLLLAAFLGTSTGLTRTIYREPGFTGGIVHVDRVPDIDLGFMTRPHGPRRMFSTRWTGVWHVDRGGTYEFVLRADDRALLRLDGETLIERDAVSGFRRTVASRELTAGPHAIDVEYEQLGGGAFLTARWGLTGDRPRTFSYAALFPATPTPGQVRTRAVLDAVLGALRWIAIASWFVVVAVVAWSGARRVRQAVRGEPHGWRGLAATRWAALRAQAWWLAPVGAALVVLLAAALRFEAIAIMYGPFERPAWLFEMEAHTRDRIALLQTGELYLGKVEQPYAGGDPINYLRNARAMTSFYAANVREPLFPFATRVWLWLVDDQDVAVSFASATFSTLAVIATWLLGTAAFSRWVGFGAALGFAIERSVIAWAAEGWRDDAMACWFVWGCYAFLRCRQRPSIANAVFAGVVGGLACLTRITALSFLVPAVVLVVWPVVSPAGGEAWRTKPSARSWRAAAIALAVMVAIVAPFLINCAIVFGDPFYAINSHTVFYRARAGLAFDRPMGVAAYLASHVQRDPIGLIATFAQGVTTYPFDVKWLGFDYWLSGLNRVLMVASAIGLIGMLASRNGRFLLVLLVCSLVPYAFTWQIPGGGEWRFTMHAYPIYLIAAALTIEHAVRLARRVLR